MNRNKCNNGLSSPFQGGRPAAFVRGLVAVTAVMLLGVTMACAENPEVAGNAITAMAHKSAQSHLDDIAQSFGQFLHWQMMLRLLLGFALAVGCAWFIAWHPRRSTKSDAAADLEESKTLILLGMVGAAVAEVSRLNQNMAFVIFGIGALVRFRTVMDNPKVTGKAIMVIIIGLACGMNQWAMAAFVTGITWILVYWLDSYVSARFKIRVTGKQDVRLIFGSVQDFLRMHRCRVKAATLLESKRSMVFVAHVPADLDPVELELSLHAKVGEDVDIEVRVY